MKAKSVLQNTKLQFEKALTKLKNSSFAKNVLILMSGTAAAQFIGFALTPIISRLFSPADFGTFGLFNAVLTVVVAGVTLDYHQAIMLPKLKEDAINLFILSCLSTVIISGCCLTLWLFAHTYFQGLLKAQDVWLPALLVATILVSGFNQAFQAWCVRVKAFSLTSVSQIIRSLSSNGTQVGLGYIQGGPTALVCGLVFGEVLASIYLARELLRDFRTQYEKVNWNRLVLLAKEYRDFPLYSASQNVINALSAGLSVILLTHFYGLVVAGAYAFGYNILTTPMRFVLISLRQVLFQRASEIQNNGGPLLPLYVKTTSGLFAMAFIPSVILIIWSPRLFSWIFGSQWETAGEYGRILVLWLIFVFCNVPAVLFAKIIRIQRFVFYYNLVLLALRASVLFLGGIYLSALHTILLFALSGMVMNASLILGVGYAIQRRQPILNIREEVAS